MTGMEGNVVPRLSPGDRNEARDAWAFIGVSAALWWVLRAAWRAAVRSVQ